MKSLLLVIVTMSTWGAFATELPSYIVKNQKELSSLQKELQKSEPGSEMESWLRWQVILNAPQVGSTELALNEIKILEKAKQRLIGKDQISITKGRILFQKNHFNEALTSYEQVPKQSEFWFEALEEQAWSYIRLNQNDKATAKLATLLSPVFQTWVGPETYYAANYAALKVCDYTKVFNYGKTFKERNSTRVAQLEKLAESGGNDQTDSVLPRLESGEMNFMAFAKEAVSLPRFFWRDEFLRRAAKNHQRSEMLIRLQALAKAELTEYRTVIQKLNLIEAEVIQRLYLDESLKGIRPQLAKVKTDSNTLSFPESDELWVDEIDSFQARVKSCPQLKEAHL